MYPYGDERACAAQILRLIRSEDLRRELVRNARKYVEQYSLEQVQPQVWGQYSALVSLKVTLQ